MKKMRQSKYSRIAIPKLIAILEKFKEESAGFFGMQKDQRRKTAEAFIKKLKS